MQWRGRRQSGNVDDMRGQRISRGGAVGIGGTGLVIIVVLALLTGQNPLDLLGQIASQQGGSAVDAGQPYEPSEADREQREFVAVVLGDTEDVWSGVFRSELGREYQEPRLVLFSGGVESGCGFAQAQVGPFYCPLDQKVYIDLSFYEEMRRKFNVSGDFAQAYVVAHEVGHHVQMLLGIAEKVQELKNRSDERTANQIQVRMELQADCLAGVWANLNNQMKNRLEPGDVEEALNAATQIGDDMIQKKMTGRVVPDAFTHGSAAQRVRWFRTGLDSGRIEQCDTFNTANL